ncbi:MAG: hypothetical protein ACRD3A_04780 [Terriglobales bacterium]
MAEIREAVGNYSGVDVTLVTTTEGVVITADMIAPPYDSVQAVILAWGQLTTGAGVTTVTPRIRRGNTITGALVGEANAEALKVAAGSTEPFFIMVAEDLVRLSSIQYSFTLQQTGGAANGTVLQASIVVWLL